MNMKRFICACLALLMTLCAAALADGYVAANRLKPTEALYCLDRSDVLSEDTEGEIVYSNDLLSEKCGAQIAVVTLGTTGSEAIDDYAYELFNSWGIGDAKKGNGFLLLLAIDDDDYYAVCGNGLQPKFTSGTMKQYFDRYLETDFAAKRYDAGVKKFFEAVFERVSDTYNAGVTVQDGIAAYKAAQSGSAPRNASFGGGASNYSGMDYDDESDGFGMLLGVLIAIVLIIILIRVSRRRRIMRTVYVRHAPPPPPAGPGGYRGVNNVPGMGGYRGPVNTTPGQREGDAFRRGVMYGLLRSAGNSFRSSVGSRSSGSSFRSSGSSRSSGGGFRSSGSSRSFGGGRSSGGGAGRGRH